MHWKTLSQYKDTINFQKCVMNTCINADIVRHKCTIQYTKRERKRAEEKEWKLHVRQGSHETKRERFVV